MPLFRRTVKATAPLDEFTVGLRDNRVVVGAPEPGIAQLTELRDYVGAVTGHAGLTPEGRDPVAVLSAKMDFAELVDDAASVVLLAFEELALRGVLAGNASPVQAALPDVPQHASTYDYIQAAHARALVRMEWLEAAHGVLAEHGVAVLPPLPPPEDPTLRQRQR
jgi:hypothetical protein